MMLEKRLFIAGKEVELLSNHVRLQLCTAGTATFVVRSETQPNQLDRVQLNIGYRDQSKPWMEGYITHVSQQKEGLTLIRVKEACAVLSQQLSMSIERPTLSDALNKLSLITNLHFEVPNQDYSQRYISHFSSQGTGFECLSKLERLYGVYDCVWYQQTDNSIYFGAHPDSTFYNKPFDISEEYITNQTLEMIRIVPFPVLRPGRIVNGQRINKLELCDDMMVAYWERNTFEPAWQMNNCQLMNV